MCMKFRIFNIPLNRCTNDHPKVQDMLMRLLKFSYRIFSLPFSVDNLGDGAQKFANSKKQHNHTHQTYQYLVITSNKFLSPPGRILHEKLRVTQVKAIYSTNKITSYIVQATLREKLHCRYISIPRRLINIRRLFKT
jgi:hypothetical protein